MCRGASTLRRAHARRRVSPPRGQVASRPAARTCRGWAGTRGLPRGWPNVSRAGGAERWGGGDPSRVCAESVRKPHFGPQAATEVGPVPPCLPRQDGGRPAAIFPRQVAERGYRHGASARCVAPPWRPVRAPAASRRQGMRMTGVRSHRRTRAGGSRLSARHACGGVDTSRLASKGRRSPEGQPAAAYGPRIRPLIFLPRSLLPCVGKLPLSASMLQG